MQPQFNTTITKPNIIEDPSHHQFTAPQKKIKTQLDMERFSKSTQYSEYMTFICSLQNSVASKPISATNPKLEESQNPHFKEFDNFFKNLQKLVEDTELLPREQARFGNPAFKTWHASAMELGEKFFEEFLDEERKEAKVELFCYYSDCFGSNVRIDYGTGHEMNFAILMLCLVKLGYFTEEEYELLVRGVFYR